MPDPRQRTYLDFNATAPVVPDVTRAIHDVLTLAGNPSSVHQDGRRLRAMIENARDSVARLVNCNSSEITFTSGGTEANGMAIDGLRKSGRVSDVYCSAVEHLSVIDHVQDTRILKVDESGLVDLESISKAVSESPGPVLICVMYANNETGAIQPVNEVCRIVHQYDGIVLCDAVQAPGKVTLDLSELETDLVSLSAHKIGGPQGAGALINRAGIQLEPLLIGGGQEKSKRSGTENTPGIVGFGAAAAFQLDQSDSFAMVGELRDDLEASLLRERPDAVIVGQEVKRLPNTTNVARPGMTSEQQVINLDLAGFSVSAGSACSSGKMAKSHVLKAMNLPLEIVESAIRISIGGTTTKAELDAFVDAWAKL